MPPRNSGRKAPASPPAPEPKPGEALCQLLADAIVKAPAAGLGYDSQVYVHLDAAFVAAVRETYGVGLLKARRVLLLLARSNGQPDIRKLAEAA